jgi:hypothetical protein
LLPLTRRLDLYQSEQFSAMINRLLAYLAARKRFGLSWSKTVASGYLLKHLRTLREACRDIAAAHPELAAPTCDLCAHGRLCVIDEQTENGVTGNAVRHRVNAALASGPCKIDRV